MINRAEATKLFEDNACLIKDKDVIFERVARKLLGDDAVAFAKNSRIHILTAMVLATMQRGI